MFDLLKTVVTMEDELETVKTSMKIDTLNFKPGDIHTNDATWKIRLYKVLRTLSGAANKPIPDFSAFFARRDYENIAIEFIKDVTIAIIKRERDAKYNVETTGRQNEEAFLRVKMICSRCETKKMQIANEIKARKKAVRQEGDPSSSDTESDDTRSVSSDTGSGSDDAGSVSEDTGSSSDDRSASDDGHTSSEDVPMDQ